MRKAILATAGVFILVLTVVFSWLTLVFAGPVSSGALFLLLPAQRHAGAQDVSEDHTPLHQGAVDLATGLYYRENDDLVIPGAPPLVLRRTYLSGYRVSKQFGIGTTHTGEEYLIGDGEHFQWASVILAVGTRLNFKRVSAGRSIRNAFYLHDETPSDWHGARLAWTGLNWVVRKGDGNVAIFRSCGPTAGDSCSIIWSRTPDGHTINYRRTADGTLFRIDDGADRWIAFEYDGNGRVIRAQGSTAGEVRYEYDNGGRLKGVSSNDGVERRYTYTDLDELATISEPGTSIENAYEDGRCVRQVNRFPDAEPYTFDFTYHMENGRVIRTDTDRSDGTWTRYTWGEGGYPVTETWGRSGFEPAIFTYERDAATNAVTALALTCPDRTGRPLRHASVVRAGNGERIKMDLLRTHCFWSTWRRARGEEP